jgi:hypothetical protein
MAAKAEGEKQSGVDMKSATPARTVPFVSQDGARSSFPGHCGRMVGKNEAIEKLTSGLPVTRSPAKYPARKEFLTRYIRN